MGREPKFKTGGGAGLIGLPDVNEENEEGGSAIGGSDSDIVDEDKAPKPLGEPVIVVRSQEVEDILNT